MKTLSRRDMLQLMAMTAAGSLAACVTHGNSAAPDSLAGAL